MYTPYWPGWYLIGHYDSGVGSWLLHNGDEALLLELPEDLAAKDVLCTAEMLGVSIKYVTASHHHYDHLDMDTWRSLQLSLPNAKFFHPRYSSSPNQCLSINGEPLYLIKAPKHSFGDIVTVFRGVAMTGDIELGTLNSVNDEVPMIVRQYSMGYLAAFERDNNYKIHTVVSAHLDDIRVNVNWPELFSHA